MTSGKFDLTVYYTNLLIKYNLYFIVVPTIILFVLSGGLVTLVEINDVRYQFTPTNARSIVEIDIYNSFQHAGSADNETNFFSVWIAVADLVKDGNVLSKSNAELILDVQDVILNTSIVNHDGLAVMNHSHVCHGVACRVNEPLVRLLQLRRIMSDDEWRASPVVQLHFPLVKVNEETMNVGYNVYGVKLNDRTHRIDNATLAMLFVIAKVRKDEVALFHKWTHKLNNELHDVFADKLKVLLMAEELVSEAVTRAGQGSIPYMAAAWVLVFTFTCVSINGWRPTRRLSLILCGCFCPALATAGAFGLLSVCQVQYQPIVFASIILIMAVGVDDVFIVMLLHANATQMLTATFRAALPSMTITSMTSALSFAIGLLSQTPAVFTFCLYSFLAILFAYLSHVTIFVAVIVRFQLTDNAKRTDVTQAGSNDMQIAEVRQHEVRRGSLALGLPNNEKKVSPVSSVTRSQKYAIGYIELLQTTKVRLMTLVFYLVFITIAIVGVVRLKPGIVVSKLIAADDPVQDYLTLDREEMPGELKHLMLIVNRPGDLRQPHQLQRNLNYIANVEQSSGIYGSAATQCWLQDYLQFVTMQLAPNETFSYAQVPAFLVDMHGRWNDSVHIREDECYSNRPDCVLAYSWTTAYMHLTSYTVAGVNVAEWRAVSKSSGLDATIYAEHTYFIDQVVSIEWNTKMSAIVGLFAMTAICSALMHGRWACIVAAALNVLSVNIGVFGYLHWWGLQLDPLCMAALLMSIGFSVDFCAHSAYHYYSGRNNGFDPKSALIDCLEKMSYPVLQAAVTTLIAGVLPVMSGIYLNVVFTKTITLVVVLGIAHTSIILPVLLLTLEEMHVFVKQAWNTSGYNVREQRKDEKDHSELP